MTRKITSNVTVLLKIWTGKNKVTWIKDLTLIVVKYSLAKWMWGPDLWNEFTKKGSHLKLKNDSETFSDFVRVNPKIYI